MKRRLLNKKNEIKSCIISVTMNLLGRQDTADLYSATNGLLIDYCSNVVSDAETLMLKHVHGIRRSQCLEKKYL